ncbi:MULTISPECIES: PHP domain-containing protein [Methanobacterium]|jgi:predicted metal-dependent phosphoesterase TrpH|uniref:PHP domain-containing protein n=1 Tax=Methanobacterium veterum TaxID=408577 RepID=A0A9E5A3J0_9EURY|nr:MULTISPECIES: PHP domain-containing protein [Methanobacterium]MCZ3365075.1 PHP domain-containing protein [Methanobacterium veterum]MCZ3372830.1 PHP domain-containing protein [Methanobacterium veterum]
MKYDLHSHSKYSSDGILDPRKIIKVAVKKGLDGIAVTDHNTIKGGLEAKKYETDDFKVIIGSEVMTTKGEVIGLFLSEEIKSKDFYDVIEEIKAQNGIVVLPHPFDEWRYASFPAKEDVKYIDNIEIFNSRCVKKKYNDNASKFAKKYKLGVTGGSDAHFANEIGHAGIIVETDDIYEAILKNNLQVFGKTSTNLNHVFTKMLKIWKKHF